MLSVSLSSCEKFTADLGQSWLLSSKIGAALLSSLRSKAWRATVYSLELQSSIFCPMIPRIWDLIELFWLLKRIAGPGSCSYTVWKEGA